MTATALDTALIDLIREVGFARNALQNNMSTRVHHPSFGVTKTRLRRDLAVYTGLLLAHRIMTGNAPHNAMSPVGLNDHSVAHFNFDLDAFAQIIDAS
jgi:hypothetical protein